MSLSHGAGEVVGHVSAFVLRNNLFTMGFDFAKGTLDGMVEAFDKDKGSTAEKQRKMRLVTESMRLLPPAIKGKVDRMYAKGERPTFTEVSDLLNVQNWIRFFQGSGMDARVTDLFSKLGITDDEKAQLYYEFATNCIPLSLQDQFPDTFGDSTQSGPEKIAVMNDPKNKKDILLALQYMLLGADGADPQSVSFQIARATLKDRYQNNDGTMKSTFYEEMVQASIGRPNLQTPEEIRNALSASRLKGILSPELGLFGDAQRLETQARLSQRSMERQLVLKHDSAIHRQRTKVDRISREAAAETIGETFSNMSGFEKLALVALAGMMLTKKTGQFILGTGALMYFGHKIALQQDDPLNNAWLPFIRKISIATTKAVQGPVERLTGHKFMTEKLTPEEVEERFAIIDRFMRDELRIENRDSIQSMACLGEMSLRDLMNCSKILPNGQVAIDYSADVKKKMESIAGQMGIDPRSISNFFEKGPKVFGKFTRNALAGGEAAARLAYSVAVQLFPQKYQRQIDMVEQSRSALSVSHMNLPDTPQRTDVNGDANRENLDAHTAYMEVVVAGMNALNNPANSALASQKTGDYMRTHLRVAESSDVERQIAREQQQYTTLKHGLEAYNTYQGEGVQFTVGKEEGDFIPITLAGTNLTINYSFQSFIAKNDVSALVEDVVTKMYERKVGEFAEKMKDHTPKLNAPKRLGNKVQFTFESDEWKPLKPYLSTMQFLHTPIRDANNSINLRISRFIAAFNAIRPDADGKKDLSGLKMDLWQYVQ